jgi:hypothetical protein
MSKMKAAVFVKPGRIVLDEKLIPDIGPLDALMRALAEFCRASGFTRPISPYRLRPWAPVFPIFRSSQRLFQEVRSVCGASCRQFPVDVSIYDRSSPIDSSSIRSSMHMSCLAISGTAC